MIKDITEVFDEWFDSRMTEIHTTIPGEIVSYDGHNERKASVKPLVKLRTINNDIVEIKEISNVPVIFPSTKNFNMVFPIQKGDGVLLHFSEAGIGNYLNSTTVQDPDDSNRFDLTDCIAVPGMWSFRNTPTLTGANDTDFFLKFKESFIQIKENGEIILSQANGNLFEMTSSGIKWTDLTNNTIESTGVSVKINNNLEVLQ